MRILIIIIFSALTAFGQYGGNKTGGYGGQGFGGSGSSGQRFSAVDLDGSTEHTYRDYAAADSFLNFNGYDRFQNANSTGFESTIGTWLNKGNHAIDTVTANKIFGNKSGRIISSGAGDSLANFVCVVPSVTSYHGVVAANKYTMELWHKALFVSPGDSLIIYHGGKRKAFLASTTAGKAVYNYEANSFTVTRDTIKIYTNNASGDTVLIDSVNFSQAYEGIIEYWSLSRLSGTTASSQFGRTNPGATRGIFQIIGNSTGSYTDESYSFNLSDSVTTYSIFFRDGSSFLNDFQWHYHLIYIGRDSLSYYLDGVWKSLTKSGTLANLGRFDVNKNGAFAIGVRNLDLFTYSNGLIGEFRMTRFNKINSSTWTTATPLATYTAYTRGNGFSDALSGGGKKIALWLDFTTYDTDGNMLMDLSGNGYNVTGQLVTTDDHVFWKR